MRYECERCHATLFTTDTDKEDHICKDLKSRYNRQKKAIDAITTILNKYHYGDGRMESYIKFDSKYIEDIALEIVRAIRGLNLEDT